MQNSFKFIIVVTLLLATGLLGFKLISVNVLAYDDLEQVAVSPNSNSNASDNALERSQVKTTVAKDDRAQAVQSLVSSLSKKVERMQSVLDDLEVKINENNDLTETRKADMLKNISDAQAKLSEYLDKLNEAETTDEVRDLAKDFNDDYLQMTKDFRNNSEIVRLGVANGAKERLEALNQKLNNLQGVVDKYCPGETNNFQVATESFEQEMEALNAALDTGDLKAIREQLQNVKSSLQSMKTDLIQSRNRCREEVRAQVNINTNNDTNVDDDNTELNDDSSSGSDDMEKEDENKDENENENSTNSVDNPTPDTDD